MTEDDVDNVEWDDKAQSWVPATGRPGAHTAMWDGEAWVRTGKNPEGPGALRRGLATGYEQTKGLVFDVLPALAYSSFGYDEAATKNLLDFKARMDKLEEQGLKSRVGLEDVKDLGSAGQFALEAIGESPASILATIATGGAGGILGKIAGNRAVAAAESVAAKAALQYGQGRALSPLVARRAEEIASKTGLKVLDEEVQRQAIRQVYNDMGMLAGAAVGTGAQNIPESFANLYDETGELRPGEAFAAGALKSALDLITPIQLLRRTRGPDVADKVSDAVAAKLLKGRKGPAGAVAGTLETMVTEGLTEGAQEFIDQMATTILADKSVDWMRILESSLKGGIGGAPFGAAAGYMGQRSREQREQAEVARIEEAAQQKAAQQAAIEDLHRLPEDYQKRREFGEYFYDVAYHNQRVRALEEGLRQEKAKKAEANPAELERYQKEIAYHRGKLEAPEGFAVATRERLTAKLADHYGMNDEEQAALLKMPRNEFEAVLREAAQDPTAISKIPELRDVDFLFTDLPRVQQLLLPPPTPFAYNVPGVGVVSAKQADAIIQRWWGRPSLSEDMTPEREDKARQLNELDPQVNPQAANIDPNERRMLALNIIFGSGNVQLVQAGEGFAGPIPLPGNTVPDLEPIDRVTVTGQAGPRSQMWAFGNIYQRIVAEMPNAPTKNLGLSWLKEAAGVTRERDPERKAALEKLIESSAANIWKQLEIDGMVTRRGIGYRAVPEGLRLQELGAQELQRVLNLDSLNKALDAAAKTQNTLGLTWLTRAVGKPILPHEARSIWNRLEASGAVVPAGAYYKAVPRDKRVPGKSKVAAPSTPPSAAPTGTPQPGTTDVLGAVPNNLAPAKFDGGGNIVQKANVNALPNGEMKRRINRVLPKLNTVQEKLLYLRNFLMDQMRQVAKETLTVLDLDTGKLAGVESSNDYGMVQASLAIRQTMGDFSKRFVFQHAHPSNTGLSGADIRATLSTPGIVGALAHGSRGLDSLILVPTQIRGFFAGLTPQRDYVLYRVAELAEYGLREYYTSDFILNNLPFGTTLKKGELFALRISLRNLALAQTGLFQYADTSQARLRQLFPNLNDLIDGFRVDSTTQMVLRSIAGKLPKAAEKVRSSNAQDAILNFDRLSQRILQPGGLEAALGSGAQPAAKPGKGGLPGVPTGYPAETEGGRGDGATEGDYPDGRLTLEAETPRDLTSMGRRGFLRGVGAAASQAGMPGTSLVKGAVEAGAGIKDMVAKADAIRKALDTISETKYSFFDFPRLFSKWTNDSERTDMLEKIRGSGPVGELASRLHQTLGEIWGPYNSPKVSSDLDYMVAGHAYTDSDAEYSRRLLERAAPREYSVARTLVANEHRIKRELASLGEKFQRIQDEARKSFDSIWKGVGWAQALGIEQDREGHFRLTRALHIGDTYGAIGRLMAASNPANTVVDPIDLLAKLDPDMNFAKAYPVAKELMRSGALDSYENFSRFWAARMPPDTLARYLEPFKLRGRGDDTSTSMKQAFNELGSLRDDLAFLDNLPAENVQNLVNYAANLSPQMTAHLNDVSRKLLSEFQQEAKKAAPIIERAQQQLKSIVNAYRDIRPALREKSRMSTDEVERAEEKKRLMDEMRQDVVTRLAGDYTWREMVQPLPGTMRQGSLVLPSSMGELAPAMNTLTKELERQDKMADALNEAYSCRI